MDFKSKIIIFVLFATLQAIEGAVPITTNQIIKSGCAPLDPLVRCVWNVKQCDTITNIPCRGIQICCLNECGTNCRIPIPSPVKCPPINKAIVCVWCNEQCNYTNKLCPTGSICCKDNCGSFCVGTNQTLCNGYHYRSKL